MSEVAKKKDEFKKGTKLLRDMPTKIEDGSKWYIVSQEWFNAW